MRCLPAILVFGLLFGLIGCAAVPSDMNDADQQRWRSDLQECKTKGREEMVNNSSVGDWMKNYGFGIWSSLFWSEDDKSTPRYADKVTNDCMVSRGWPKPF